MKKIVFSVVLMVVSMAASAQDEPLWMRFSAISPDGQTIAFSYKGDIFTVPTTGGNARQLTSNAAYDAYPVWSPDGKKLAFASSREGSLDVYVINATGGSPVRLTTHSSDEVPMTFSDDSHVLFSAALMPTAQSNIFAGGRTNQVYEVSVEGGRPSLFSTLMMEDVSVNSRGDVLYHDWKGYEDPFRKHHQSPICRDIWLCQGGKYTKLSSFKGEDRTPRWADDTSYYYLSEEDGTFNVYRRNIDGSGKQQLTKHQKNPVRYLSVSRNGMLCYGYDGEIYTLKPGGQPQKVKISITADRNDRELVRQVRSNGATEISLSPSGKEVAFVMHGDVFVTSVDYKTTKQVTDTPEQERSINFAPDGKSIVYCAERGGHWQIYRTKLKKADEKLFTYSTELEEERLTNTDVTSLQPKFSPDGKEVAFFENRGELRVINLATKQVRTVMDGKYNFSYSDGDLWFEWSPDSRWLLSSYIGTGGWNNQDVALVNASGNGEIHNLTQSGYNDGSAKWVLGGKAMLFESDRAGYRSHGSWGAETDYYVMFFDVDAYDRFRMTKEEKVMREEAEKEAKGKALAAKNKEQDAKGKKPANKKKATANSQTTPSKALQFDLTTAVTASSALP